MYRYRVLPLLPSLQWLQENKASWICDLQYFLAVVSQISWLAVILLSVMIGSSLDSVLHQFNSSSFRNVTPDVH